MSVPAEEVATVSALTHEGEGVVRGGKTAFVAGASSGINLQIATRLAQAGAAVTILSRSPDKIEAAAASIRAIGARCIGIAQDVRDHEGVGAAFAKSVAAHGEVDILVSGAAGNFVAPFNGISYNGFRAVIDIDLVGAYNVRNALAAIAIATEVGISVERIGEGLREFAGVKRRLEVVGVADGVTVYDDFAHHPTAIETTLVGLRAKVLNGRIVAVLDPRSNTMKAGTLKDRLAASLAAADLVYCYSAGLAWDAAATLAPLGRKAVVENDFEQLLGAVAETVRPGDHVLVMSNGGFNGIHEKLLARLRTIGDRQ